MHKLHQDRVGQQSRQQQETQAAKHQDPVKQQWQHVACQMTTNNLSSRSSPFSDMVVINDALTNN